MRRGRRSVRTGRALAASLALHAGVVALLVVAPGAPEPPRDRVIAVDIVSPPPNLAGAPPREALSNQDPGPPAEPAPAETPPAPDPLPPAADPAPPPPRAEAPKEPAKAPEPRRTPPERPAPRPPTTPPSRPATPEKNRTATDRPSTASGSGTGSTRTRGDGTSTAPATGATPQPGSPGGEGINIHVEGDPCPVAGYCERVTVQVQRYFRAPPDNAGARGEVCFRILRDGSVTEIAAQRVRGGGAAFRLAMMEAAEAAGSRRAFGALPPAFDPQRWKWCVELTPR